MTRGQVYALGVPVGRDTPAFPPRFATVTVMMPDQFAGSLVPSENTMSYADDMFTGWLGVGSQIDSFAHLGIDNTFYNGNKAADFMHTTGVTKLGVEGIPPMVSRGVLVDMARARNKPMLEVTEEEFERVYDINVRSIFHMSRAAVPRMQKQGGGVIINVGSVAGIRPRPGLTWYNSTKGAVNLLSRSMAVELAPHNIRVNCVAPVMGATGLIEQFMGVPDTPENRARFIATIPLGRFSTPRDIANACLYLASDDADFITGVVLEVDGGRTV